MAAGDCKGGLASVLGLPGHAMQEQRATGDGLAMFLGLGQTDKQIPPVVDQCHRRLVRRQRLRSLVV